MIPVIPLPTFIYQAMPPELNTSRLMTGAGAAPMAQAAAGWEVFSVFLEAQADELAASLLQLQSMWSGAACEQAVQATMPMITWLRTLSMQAMRRSMAALAQASAYTAALATTPPIPEIEQNHVTHGVLESTNFFGVNTVPIGVNEADYFIRMWNQAAGAMHAYMAETSLNTIFEPVTPPQPIVIPGVGETAVTAVLASAAASLPDTAMRDAVFTMVTGTGLMQSARLNFGQAASLGESAAQGAQDGVQHSQDAAQQAKQPGQQGLTQGVQMATQMGSMAGQLPMQLMQGVTQPFQQLSQPLQQMTSMFSQFGGSGAHNGAQVGMVGASPFSNHPLIGGSGASSGSGLVRAASLPGAGGLGARTPLMSSLIGERVEASVTASAVAPGAGAGSSGGGLAPVGAGGGGGTPMGMTGGREQGGGTKSKVGLTAPRPLTQDLDDDDDW